MYASRMFHSLGTVQSKTSVPVATSWIVKGSNSPTFARLWPRDAAADQFNQVASRRLGVDEVSQIRQSSDVEIHCYPVVGEHRATIEIAESLIERSTRKARKQDSAFGALEVPTRKRRATTTRYTSVHVH